MKQAFVFLCAALLAGCTSMRTVKSTAPCPSAGQSVRFAKIMNRAFASDYVGCDVTTVAEFYSPGQGSAILSGAPLNNAVVFRCSPPGVHGENNPSGAELQSCFVLIPKDKSDMVFELNPGDLVELRGAPHVSYSSLILNSIEIEFVATSMKRAEAAPSP